MPLLPGLPDRESIIIRYSPFSFRQAGPFATAVARLDQRGGLDTASPVLHQLLGLRLMEEAGGSNIYDPAWLAQNPRADLRIGQPLYPAAAMAIAGAKL